MITIDLSKQKAPAADPKPIQQINFTGNLDRDGSTTVQQYYLLLKSDRNHFKFWTMKVL